MSNTRRKAWRRGSPHTPTNPANHVLRGIWGDQCAGVVALALEEAGFDVDWDTVDDETMPIVVSWEGEEVVVTPHEHIHTGFTRWQA
jgi:hypothetical protein